MYNPLQQVYESEARYCRDAVASAALVTSCPASQIEWDTAARKKNCSRIASHQNCTTVEKFQYHCVINGYRNETLEVCAPSRIIFGKSVIYIFILLFLPSRDCLILQICNSLVLPVCFMSGFTISRTLCRVQSIRRSNSGSTVISMQRHISQM